MNLSELTAWDKNPKSSTNDEKQKLKKMLEIGQLAPLLVLLPEKLVLGGNQRLSTMREMGITEWDVTRIYIKESNDKFFVTTINENGAEIAGTREFNSRFEAMSACAFAHNSQTGHYEIDKLREVIENAPALTLQEFNVGSFIPINLEPLESTAPENLTKTETNKKPKMTITFDSVNDLELAKEMIEEELREMNLHTSISVSAGEL